MHKVLPWLRKVGGHVTVHLSNPSYLPPPPPIHTTGQPIRNLTLSSKCGRLQSNIAHPCCGQLTAVKTGNLLTSIIQPLLSLAQELTHQGYTFFLKLSSDKLIVFN